MGPDVWSVPLQRAGAGVSSEGAGGSGGAGSCFCVCFCVLDGGRVVMVGL